TVADAALSATGTPISPVEGSLVNGLVATFSDADPNGMTADYKATINWGDGSSSPGTVSPNAQGNFDIRGAHAYAEEGSYTVSATVTDAGGSSARGAEPVTVADAALSATATPISPVEGSLVNGLVATFSDADPNGTTAD